MSQYATTLNVLHDMIIKYPQEYHEAIIETFGATLSDNWNDESIEEFFKMGLEVAPFETKELLKREAGSFGIAL